MNCWPTMPVAPRMPTGIRAMLLPLFSKKKADTENRVGRIQLELVSG